MDITEVQTNRGKRSIIWDYNRYRLDTILKQEDISWRCSVHTCPARIRTDKDVKTVISQKNTHTHDPDSRKLERHKLRSAAKRKATDDLSQQPAKIIKGVLKDQEEDELEYKDLKSVAKAVYRKRRKTYPPLPKTQEETHETLSTMNIQTSKFEDFLTTNNTENGMIIFTTTTNLECLCNVDELFMDGTYKCCPKFFKQLYTVHGCKNGHYLPLIFVLLSGQSTVSYQQCLMEILNLCTQKGLQFSPKIVHVDFEEAMMKAIRQVLPTATIKCCRFHLGQAWWRKIQNLGLSYDYKDSNSEISKWLSAFFGLAFLPADQVEDSFAEDLMSEMPSNEKCVKFADYLTNCYITAESLFPPQLWAESPSFNKRTNNGPESFHKQYNAQFYSSHPSIYVFIDVLIGIQATTYIKMRTLNSAAPVQKNDREKIQFLVEEHQKYASGEIERSSFIKKVGYRYRAVTGF